MNTHTSHQYNLCKVDLYLLILIIIKLKPIHLNPNYRHNKLNVSNSKSLNMFFSPDFYAILAPSDIVTDFVPISI